MARNPPKGLSMGQNCNTIWSTEVSGSGARHGRCESFSPASLLLSGTDWELEKKGSRAGKTRNTREAAVFWTDLVGASSEAGGADKKGGYNIQWYYVQDVRFAFSHCDRQLGLLSNFGGDKEIYHYARWSGDPVLIHQS